MNDLEVNGSQSYAAKVEVLVANFTKKSNITKVTAVMATVRDLRMNTRKRKSTSTRMSIRRSTMKITLTPMKIKRGVMASRPTLTVGRVAGPMSKLMTTNHARAMETSGTSLVKATAPKNVADSRGEVRIALATNRAGWKAVCAVSGMRPKAVLPMVRATMRKGQNMVMGDLEALTSAKKAGTGVKSMGVGTISLNRRDTAEKSVLEERNGRREKRVLQEEASGRTRVTVKGMSIRNDVDMKMIIEVWR